MIETMNYSSVGVEQANLCNPNLPARCRHYKLEYRSQSHLEVALRADFKALALDLPCLYNVPINVISTLVLLTLWRL